MMMGLFQSAWVVARRDFVATVATKAFLFFLAGPLFILGLSIWSGNVSAQMAEEDLRATVAIISGEAEFAAIEAAKARVEGSFRENELPDLVRYDADYVVEGQVRDLLASRDKQILAVLTGGLDQPKLTGAVGEDGSIRNQMTLIVNEARQQRALGSRLPPVEIAFEQVEESAGSLAASRAITARMGQLALFFLTVFLASMLLSNLVEEKSNKVIEVLAAAIPVDAIFLGKLFAMLAVSLLGIAVWAATGLIAFEIWSEADTTLPSPAVGWPMFVVLGLIYYASNYLLLGAVFLGIGSQASSVREVQTLSMPVTIGQVLIFIFASMAAGPYNSLIGIAAAVFPFSSPMAMMARAAQTPELWTHLAAIAWQALWVCLIVMLGAGLFRRNVLKSGGGGGSGAAPRGMMQRLTGRG
jgi:ABC-2 type transport system permease protein